MDEAYIKKLIDEVWGKWPSTIIIAIISVLSILLKWESFNLSASNKWSIIRFAGIMLAVVALNVFNIIIVIKKQYIKKASKGKTGILINIDAENKEVYKETIRKFGNEFQKNLYEGFSVIFVPFGKNNIEYKSEKIVSLLKRKRCVLFINVGVNTDKDENSLIYDIEINGTIIHPTYTKKTESVFQKVFTEALHNYRNIVFPSKEMIKRLRVTANEMSLACTYVIGLSFFLNGELEKADEVLKSISNLNNKSSLQSQRIYVSTKMLRNEIYIVLAHYYIEKYQSECRDSLLLDKINDYLDKAYECGGKTYEYCLNKAFYYIAKDRDVATAKTYINLCKQMKGSPLSWKYSDAFLKAYENRSLGTICSAYKNALKVDYNVIDLIIYIESILEKEPERTGLHLALGILYQSIGNSLCKEEFEKYISYSDDGIKTRTLLSKKGLYVI